MCVRKFRSKYAMKKEQQQEKPLELELERMPLSNKPAALNET